jgi:pimeloyl-ACP methyl ester carboxylesterase
LPVAQISLLSERWNIPVHLFLGERDAIIPVKAFHSFADAAPGCQMHILECGHGMLPAFAVNSIVSLLEDDNN